MSVSDSLLQRLIPVAQGFGALGVILTGIWAVVNFAIGEHIDIFFAQADLNAKLAEVDRITTANLTELNRRVDRLETPRFLQYEGFGFAFPRRVKAGERVAVFHRLKRVAGCRMLVTVNFRNWVPGTGIDAASIRQRPNIQSEIVRDFHTFRFTLTVPPHLEPGLWSYSPIFQAEPRDGCDPEPFSPPDVFFEVVV